MKKIKLKILMVLLVGSVVPGLFAQTVYEPVTSTGIYNFIERLADKGYIDFFDDIRPATRLTIAAKLLALDKQKEKLTETETERLSFYSKEYSFEIKYLNKDTSEVSAFLKGGTDERFNFYKFYKPIFTFTADPVFGVSYDFSKKNYHQFTGIEMQGRISDNWGYYFNYRDNLERGDNLDRNKSFSPVTGVIISKATNNKIEYSETRGGISYGWDWGMITAAKDFINIGSSLQSSVILSDKAPSFPYLHLEIHPVDWFRYDFITWMA